MKGALISSPTSRSDVVNNVVLISFKKRDVKLSDLSLENNVHHSVATTAYLPYTVRTAELDSVERMQPWL